MLKPVLLAALISTAASGSFAQSYCREYTSNADIGGSVQSTVGTACRQADGSWAIQGDGAHVEPARATFGYSTGYSTGYTTAPAYVAPAPVYAAPPAYYPAPVYAAPPAAYYPAPVYAAPAYAAPVYAAPGYAAPYESFSLGFDIGGHHHGNWRPGYGGGDGRGYGGGYDRGNYGHRW